MRKFILTDKEHALEDPESVKIANPNDFTAISPASWADYAHEYRPYLISLEIDAIAGNKALVFIDFDLSGIDKYYVAHQLLTNSQAAVIFYAENPVRQLHLEEDNGLFKSSAVKVISTNDMLLIANANLDELDRQYELFFDTFSYSNYTADFQRSLIYDRHQATNEWGAIKLLLNHGETLLAIKPIFDFPRTVLFSQKLKEYNVSESAPLSLSNHSRYMDINNERASLRGNQSLINKILLIDDNAERGWLLAIQHLFPNKQVTFKKSLTESEKLEFETFDLIFLDLRLPTNPGEAIRRLENGLKLIDLIKQNPACLHVPLIIFTASQKATTMNVAQQKGADAIYIKEPLDLPIDQSPLNYLGLVLEINRQLAKGKELKRYNQAINLIKNRFLPEIADTSGSLLKSRVVERLEMFYGLLKKSFEQTDYEEKLFHFSARTLAFMTLWSLLNEIQECYYERIPYSSTILAGHNPTPSSMNWKIRNTSSYFLQNNGAIKTTQYSPLKVNFSNAQPYSISSNKIVRSFDQKLSFQIAFLLLKKPSFASATKKTQYLTLLNKVNKYRNHLYLIHGEDVDSGFHSTLEAQKAGQVPDLENFFGLIAFLLTGDQNIA